MKKVMEALRGECVVIIGVYVMGSVGKTTLVEEISQRVKQERLFDEVVMASSKVMLKMHDVVRDVAISIGSVGNILFPKLERVDTTECDRQQYHFCLSLARNLSKLEDLTKAFPDDDEEEIDWRINNKLEGIWSRWYTSYKSDIPRSIWNPPLTRRGSPQPKFATRVGVSKSDALQGTRPV
ncbi:hypothetical protein T459_25905 [Capsicum annuum]|uniref:NB-ARC domain-containing protein n=1 Tax=Capsicum annuum TaxID=4072 RepID=A0A2G2YMI0_CAPAN|nr:hypothetical protein T459_25905 [Capsicum annuum]